MEIDSALFQNLPPRLAKLLPSLAEGESNRDIASEMYLAVHTVEVYISEIMDALQCQNRAEIAVNTGRYLAKVQRTPESRSWSI